MIRMNVTSNIEPAIKTLKEFSDRRIRAVIATAITRTANEVKQDWVRQMQTSLDRPTPYTLRSIRVKRADANTMTAVVDLKDSGRAGETQPSEYMAVQEKGGDRNLRKFERALVSGGNMPRQHKIVPAYGAKLDAYGNISRGQIVQVLVQLGKNLSAGYQRVISKSDAKRLKAAQRSKRRYVAILKATPDNGMKQPGIYEVLRAKTGIESLQPVFWFVQTAKYARRTHLVEYGATYAKARIVQEVDRAIAEHKARLGIK